MRQISLCISFTALWKKEAYHCYKTNLLNSYKQCSGKYAISIKGHSMNK